CQSFPSYEWILTIPGFGPIVSAMAATGDPHRFTGRKQILRLTGLDLSASRSGKQSDRVTPVISKQGKAAALRCALVQAAFIVSYKNPEIRSYFSRLLKGRELERGIKMKMENPVVRLLALIAFLALIVDCLERDRFEKLDHSSGHVFYCLPVWFNGRFIDNVH